ncbi:MAG TPA: DEAD/DEAH box helicase, partial [Candidatus Yonathbacteria bacterium]|nr:DEAD/DEAH box helicase [Candidatus Yonathbacteria bacterium]
MFWITRTKYTEIFLYLLYYQFCGFLYYTGQMKPITLDNQITENFRITTAQARALKKLRIETVRELLFHFPSRYQDLSNVKTIISLENKEQATVYGKVSGLKTKKAYRKKIPMSEATITDATGKIKVTWFHQAYISKMFAEGTPVKVSGKISERNGTRYFTNPEIEKLTSVPDDAGGSLFGDGEYETYYPVYPESRGVTSKWLYHAIKKVLASDAISVLSDPIPDKILKKYSLPTLNSALIWIHTPKKEPDARAARKRFAFQEIFFIQLARLSSRNEYEKYSAYNIVNIDEHIKKFLEQFPFTPTGAQTRAINQVVEDFASGKPMIRLIEGDVGSGKTLIAASTAYAVANARPPKGTLGNLQVAYMAPTEILARQHYQSFIEYFSVPARKGLPIQIGLLTGSECRKFPS